MKYLIATVLGVAAGIALAAAALLNNPWSNAKSPIDATPAADAALKLGYDMTGEDTLVTINRGLTLLPKKPTTVESLLEPRISKMNLAVVMMRNEAGEAVALAVKMSSASSKTRPLTGDAIVDSIWNVHLVGEGSLFAEQREQWGPFLRNIVYPAWRSDSGIWSGDMLSQLTIGPAPSREALIHGSTGRLKSATGYLTETLNVKKFSMLDGAVETQSRVTIEVE